MRKAVFLDRDGVINKTFFWNGKFRAPLEVEKFEFLPGVPEAVAKLKKSGFLLIVATNQPDVARGWQTRDRVEAMNRIVSERLGVDDVKVCYHVEQDGCDCRKPKPGMLLDAAKTWDIDLKSFYMVGDRYSDVSAGAAAGCTPILVAAPDDEAGTAVPAAHLGSLLEAADWILKRS